MKLFSMYLITVAFAFFLGNSALAELDRSKEVQEIVEAWKGTKASIWLLTTNIYKPDAIGATRYSRLSRGVFSYLSERKQVSVKINDYGTMNVELLPTVAELALSEYLSKDGKEKQMDFILGTYDSVSVLDVTKVPGNPKCEWQVIYRGWISDPTLISEAITAYIGIDGAKDGFKFQQCYKVGKNGLELVYHDLMY